MNFIKPFLVEIPGEIKRLICLMGEHTMASVITADTDGKPVSSFLPVDFRPAENGIGSIILHLANSNAQLGTLRKNGWVLVEFKSPDTYISPSWFADRNRAPTNVHAAVQCYGRPEIIDDIEQKSALLNAQVHAREKSLPQGWNPGELQGDGYDRRLKSITLVIIRVETAKASVRMLQDESPENVRAVLSRLDAQPNPQNDWIAQMIRDANSGRL